MAIKRRFTMAKNTVEAGKGCAILAYLIVGIIWYFVDDKMKKNEYARFHVRQALVLLVIGVILGILNSILVWIPVIGWIIMVVLEILLFIAWLMGIISAINGKKKQMPFLGQYAKKFNI
jgi:uncharacterized membrane protein